MSAHPLGGGHIDIGFEDGRAVPIVHAHQEELAQSAFEHLSSRELATKFIDVWEWMQEPRNVPTMLRKIAVVNRLLRVGKHHDSSWQEIADDHGCGRACISRLCSEFQKRFGVTPLGPVKLKSKTSCKTSRLKVLASKVEG